MLWKTHSYEDPSEKNRIGQRVADNPHDLCVGRNSPVELPAAGEQPQCFSHSRDRLEYRPSGLEAGIEEALTHLHEDADHPTANQWKAEEVDGQTAYWKRRALPDGSFFCVTNFGAASPSPIIVSAGYVRAPLQKDEFVSRIVRVTATNPPSVYSRAIAVNGSVKLSGGATVDGYNSTSGPYILPATAMPQGYRQDFKRTQSN